MGKKIHNIAIIPLLLTGLISCNRTIDPQPEYLSSMYPIEQGKFKNYVVDDILYTSNIAGGEARHYFKKLVTDGTETDLLDREVSKLFIYTSPDSLDSLGNRVWLYSFHELWTEYIDEKYVERTEGNIRYLPLKLPPLANDTWNGNLYNAQGLQQYQYISLDTTMNIQGKTYENCVFVLKVPYFEQGNTSDFYIREHAYEAFAPGIGTIQRHDERVEYQGGVIQAQESYFRHEELTSHNY